VIFLVSLEREYVKYYLFNYYSLLLMQSLITGVSSNSHQLDVVPFLADQKLLGIGLFRVDILNWMWHQRLQFSGV
jgi:hypothetical protein